MLTRPLLFKTFDSSLVSRFLSNFQLFPNFINKITQLRKYWNFSIESTQYHLLFLRIEKTICERKAFRYDILFICKYLLFFSYIKPLYVIWVCYYQQVFAIILETHMINPYFHIGKDEINRMECLSKTLYLLKRASIWKVIDLKFLNERVSGFLKTTAYYFDRSIHCS